MLPFICRPSTPPRCDVDWKAAHPPPALFLNRARCHPPPGSGLFFQLRQTEVRLDTLPLLSSHSNARRRSSLAEAIQPPTTGPQMGPRRQWQSAEHLLRAAIHSGSDATARRRIRRQWRSYQAHRDVARTRPSRGEPWRSVSTLSRSGRLRKDAAKGLVKNLITGAHRNAPGERPIPHNFI